MDERIRAAKRGFEQSFASGTFYNRQTQDEQHLQQILALLPFRSGMHILDLGTGTGYLAFPIAEMHPEITVTGLDIVETALDVNREKAAQEQLSNLRFVTYDGTRFPFADGTFDLVISRYALHHFPDIRGSIAEISRVLTAEGCFFLSDPAPNEDEPERFVDAFMQMNPDGHIRFYTCAEWDMLCGERHMQRIGGFESRIRFPRKYSAAYDALLRQYPDAVAESYEIQKTGDEILITEQVSNLLYQKQK